MCCMRVCGGGVLLHLTPVVAASASFWYQSAAYQHRVLCIIVCHTVNYKPCTLGLLGCWLLQQYFHRPILHIIRNCFLMTKKKRNGPGMVALQSLCNGGCCRTAAAWASKQYIKE